MYHLFLARDIVEYSIKIIYESIKALIGVDKIVRELLRNIFIYIFLNIE